MLRARHIEGSNRSRTPVEWSEAEGFSWTSLPLFVAVEDSGVIPRLVHTFSGLEYTAPATEKVLVAGKWFGIWDEEGAHYKQGVSNSLFMKNCFDFSAFDHTVRVPAIVQSIAPEVGDAVEDGAQPAAHKPFEPCCLPARRKRKSATQVVEESALKRVTISLPK